MLYFHFWVLSTNSPSSVYFKLSHRNIFHRAFDSRKNCQSFERWILTFLTLYSRLRGSAYRYNSYYAIHYMRGISCNHNYKRTVKGMFVFYLLLTYHIKFSIEVIIIIWGSQFLNETTSWRRIARKLRSYTIDISSWMYSFFSILNCSCLTILHRHKMQGRKIWTLET